MSENVDNGHVEEVSQVKPTADPLKADTPKGVKETTYVTFGMMCTVVILVSIMTAFASLLAYHRMYATKIVVFDMQGYLRKLRKGVVEKKITEDQALKLLDSLTIKINAMPKNTIIITGDVILGKNAKKLDIGE